MNLTQNKTAVAIMNQAFGDTWKETITDIFGYQTQLVNQAALESETDEGEHFVENPQTREEFLDLIILQYGLRGVMEKVADAQVTRYRAQKKSEMGAVMEAIEKSV